MSLLYTDRRASRTLAAVPTGGSTSLLRLTIASKCLRIVGLKLVVRYIPKTSTRHYDDIESEIRHLLLVVSEDFTHEPFHAVPLYRTA